MPQARPHTLRRRHEIPAEAALAWQKRPEPSALERNALKHGVAHLFVLGRNDEAEARLLDLPFMDAFCDAYDTFVKPLMHWRVLGMEKAREGYQRVAEGLGPHEEGSEEMARTARAVSSTLEDFGLYGPGGTLAEWALPVLERVLGAEDKAVLSAMSTVAHLYTSQGRYDEAEPLCLRALEAFERTLGKEHPDTLTSVNNLAGLYRKQGRYDEAEPLYLRALEARERTLGKEHPDTLTSVNNLAGLYKSQGRYDEAEPLFLRALEARERTLGKDHPSTLSSIDALEHLHATRSETTNR